MPKKDDLISSELRDKLANSAMKAMANAYAPYSNFHVGAAILAADGKIYCGCNVENAAYPVGSCAEASATSAMISAGQKQINAIAVAGKGDDICTPCGECRQRIREFSKPMTPIIYFNGSYLLNLNLSGRFNNPLAASSSQQSYCIASYSN